MSHASAARGTKAAARMLRRPALLLPMLLAALLPAAAFAQAAAQKKGEPLRLDPTQITGSREQPRVLNIVPWKRPPSAAPAGQPADSVLDEAMQPLDRVEFRRELRYYEGLPAGGEP